MHKSPLHSICRILVPLLLTLSLLTSEARATEATPKDLLLVITVVEADSGEPVVGAIVKSALCSSHPGNRSSGAMHARLCSRDREGKDLRLVSRLQTL